VRRKIGRIEDRVENKHYREHCGKEKMSRQQEAQNPNKVLQDTHLHLLGEMIHTCRILLHQT
jgi:hypothetical protein